MSNPPSISDKYITPERKISFIARAFPSFVFYVKLIKIVLESGIQAKRGDFDDSVWVDKSVAVLKSLESVGIRVNISGIENITKTDKPMVFIGNHMSMMETFLLPFMIQPLKSVTFVIKESLLTYPVFKYVMMSRNPIAVTRTNPRQDLKTVLSEGENRLNAQQISVIVFPQTTRAIVFDAKQMSSIGVKLAKKAGVEIVPVAVKTDCWQNGQLLKDFGKIDTARIAYFAFGEPIAVESKGELEHQRVNEFIEGKLKEWT